MKAKLRKLEKRDANYMLEWMQDDDLIKYLKKDFKNMSIDDCERFIQNAKDMKAEIHRAIVDENNIYMGTVSLKHIKNGCAEFAIVVRKEAMGTGFSQYAIKQIIQEGFEKEDIKKIYWCVDPKNERARRFYKKCGYHEQAKIYDDAILKCVNEYYGLLWMQRSS